MATPRRASGVAPAECTFAALDRASGNTTNKLREMLSIVLLSIVRMLFYLYSSFSLLLVITEEEAMHQKQNNSSLTFLQFAKITGVSKKMCHIYLFRSSYIFGIIL